MALMLSVQLQCDLWCLTSLAHHKQEPVAVAPSCHHQAADSSQPQPTAPKPEDCDRHELADQAFVAAKTFVPLVALAPVIDAVGFTPGVSQPRLIIDANSLQVSLPHFARPPLRI